MKFRKRPIIVEAERVYHSEKPSLKFFIETLEGRMEVKNGDWIVTGIEGEKYPCKDSIFKATYEPIEDDKDNMFRKDFEKMSIPEIKSVWQEDMNSFGVDGRMDLLTPWDYRMILKELLKRIEALCDGKSEFKATYEPVEDDNESLDVTK